MSKAPPPLLGFNNNVRHRGRIFHIQTEDSGVKFPRIVTHLFADGGRIVKTTRTDYSEHVEKTDMAVVVRGMMKEQHKAMFAALRTGDLDHLLENVCGPLDAPVSKNPESLGDPTAKNDLESARLVVAGAASLAPVRGEPSNLPAVAATAERVEGPAQPEAVENVKSREAETAARSGRPISNPNLRRPTPSVTPPVAQAFDLDVASLDKLPGKPSRTPPAPSARPRKSNPAPRKSRPPAPVRPAPQAAVPAPPVAAAAAAAAAAGDASPNSLGRPQTRLAAAPQTNARSIFGDGAISEQSLDEVILSYLAEDLEETK